MNLSTDRQRVLAHRIGPSLNVPRQSSEAGRIRSVKAQIKEKTNISLSEGVVLEWLRHNSKALPAQS